MKSAKDIQDEIDSYKRQYVVEKDVKVRKRIKAKLPDLETLLKYSATNPSKEFVESEKLRLENRISEIMKTYAPLNDGIVLLSARTKHRSEFEKKWELPKLRKQLSQMNYLLKSN